MNEKLKFSNLASLSLMLFAMFFGAGNMIFPPMLGQQAGTNFLQGIAGFVVTDAGLSVLGIAAVVMVGTKIEDLAGLISHKFGIFMSIMVYFLIGPLFALPRTGTVSFELAVVPFVPQGVSVKLISLIFTALFFGITFILCLNTSKIVNIVGKVLTPILIIAILVIFAVSLINPVGTVGAPTGDYSTIPFFKGLIEGYLALDGMAGLAFAIIAINAVKGFGIKEPKRIAKYTIICGVFAELGLAAIYLALGHIGAQTSSLAQFENGGALLANVVNQLLGRTGNLILGVAVLMACLTTSIGLASSFSDYFHSIFPKLSYNKILVIVCLFSFAISNVGLTSLIKYSLPALIMIYPPTIALVLFSFANKWIKGKAEAYVLAMAFSLVIGIFDGLKHMKISLGFLSELVSKVPFYNLGIGWIVPSIIGCLIGLLPFVNFMGAKKEQNILGTKSEHSLVQ